MPCLHDGAQLSAFRAATMGPFGPLGIFDMHPMSLFRAPGFTPTIESRLDL